MNDLTIRPQQQQQVSTLDRLLNVDTYQQLQRIASDFAKSQLVPSAFQGRPHDVLIALQMADRLGADPMMVLQNLYIVSGNPGWKATFAIAQANACRVFAGPIRYREEGDFEKLDKDGAPADGASVVAYAKLAADGEPVESRFEIRTARIEGWTARKSNKYISMPRQQMSYRAAFSLIRLYCPEVLLGVPVADELEDIQPAAPSSPPPARGVAGFAELIDAEPPQDAPGDAFETEAVEAPRSEENAPEGEDVSDPDTGEIHDLEAARAAEDAEIAAQAAQGEESSETSDPVASDAQGATGSGRDDESPPTRNVEDIVGLLRIVSHKDAVEELRAEARALGLRRGSRDSNRLRDAFAEAERRVGGYET